MARGLDWRAVFRADEDREHWKGLLSKLPERFAVRIHGWVLMGNHFHLQVETPEANLSRALQWLNVSYAVWFNRRPWRIAPLFSGRFRAELTDTERWVAEVNRYIHLNPVRTTAHGLGKGDVAPFEESEPGRGPGTAETIARLPMELLPCVSGLGGATRVA
jgi:REP element-mobilizing transposase RayT